jgi:hypothetical protein
MPCGNRGFPSDDRRTPTLYGKRMLHNGRYSVLKGIAKSFKSIRAFYQKLHLKVVLVALPQTIVPT